MYGMREKKSPVVERGFLYSIRETYIIVCFEILYPKLITDLLSETRAETITLEIITTEYISDTKLGLPSEPLLQNGDKANLAPVGTFVLWDSMLGWRRLWT